MTIDQTGEADQADQVLSEAEVAEFEQNGMLVLRGVLDGTQLGRLVEAGDRLVADPSTPGRQQQASGVWDSIRNCIGKSDEMRELIAHPRVLPAVVRLMGSNLRLTTSHLIYRNPDQAPSPGAERVPPWHRDIAHVSEDLGFAHTPRLQIKAAYCLTELPGPDTGGTVFLPGSHLLKRRPPMPPGTDPHGAIEPEMQAGDCVIFENRVLHAGGWNLAGRVRKSIMIAYGYRWLASVDYRRQPESVRDRMSEVERFLVGESTAHAGEFTLGGAQNPLDTPSNRASSA